MQQCEIRSGLELENQQGAAPSRGVVNATRSDQTVRSSHDADVVIARRENLIRQRAKCPDQCLGFSPSVIDVRDDVQVFAGLGNRAQRTIAFKGGPKDANSGGGALFSGLGLEIGRVQGRRDVFGHDCGVPGVGSLGEFLL